MDQQGVVAKLGEGLIAGPKRQQADGRYRALIRRR